MSVRWVSAFLDFAPEEYDEGLAFWRDLTGYDVSPARGDRDEFVTLLPPTGDDHLRVQRLAEGPSRIHVDLHVPDLDTATEHALAAVATRLERPHSDVTTLASPGGFTFCLVTLANSVKAPPTEWPDGHTSLVDQVCLDIPSAAYDDEARFWRRLTGWESHRSSRAEFAYLARPQDQPIRILLQRLDEPEGRVRAHLDWATTDRAAETTRHVAAGAHVVEEFPWWTVLSGPVGPAYCITDRAPETGMLR